MTARLEQPESVDLGFAVVDVDRERRQGLAEVVYAPGKTVQQISAIAATLLGRQTGPVLVSRIDVAAAAEVGRVVRGWTYHADARLLVWRALRPKRDAIRVAVVAAGTADRPIAREASVVSSVLGARVTEIHDVGVAGLHRLLAREDDLRNADVVVVIAGMEAALASAVAGLVEVPVIAVPTSVGYGAAFEGITALLGMLTGCSAGVTVVNIDSGFTAALAAHRMSRAMRGRP
jgi:NCAIR mutase (PurE)-related protein